jgi:hypothetical protein
MACAHDHPPSHLKLAFFCCTTVPTELFTVIIGKADGIRIEVTGANMWIGYFFNFHDHPFSPI